MKPLLEVENLSIDFTTRSGPVHAVQDLSFSLGEGESLAIVGESGSGKSVTALSLLGLIPPPGRVTAGSLTYAGRDLLDLSGRQMREVRGREIAMVFQDPMTSLNPVLRIGEQLGEALRWHDSLSKEDIRDRVVETLRLVGIPNAGARLSDYPHQFSGGQRQRIMIAMAIICRPALLLADEPTTALDFAYAVHTDVGDTCIGAKINSVQRPLRTPLETGDVVLVLRSDNAPVPAEWESIAVTGRARSAIRRRIKKMQRDEHLALGRSIAESVFTGAHLQFSIKGVRAGLRKLGKKSVEDVLVSVGRGDLPVSALIEAVYPGASAASEGEIRPASLQAFKPRVAIAGLTPGVSVAMARCCTPLPGERIVGIRDDEGGVLVHTIYCDTLAAEDPPQSRWLDLKWRDSEDDEISAFARITITVQNGVGVLSEVAGIIARYGVSIASMRLVNRSREFLDMVMDVEVKDAKQLSQMLAGVRAAPSVIAAERLGSKDDEEL